MKNFTIKYILAALVLSCLWSSCTSNKEVVIKKEEKISIDERFAFDFIKANSLSPVLDIAEAEGKLVFLDVYTSWCLPCRMMEEDVFTHGPTADVINEGFVSYKVDAEKENGPDLATIYEVRSYPTLLFLDSKGRVLERKEGAAYHRELLALADSAKSKYPAQ